MGKKAFTFICGEDDYLLSERGKAWFAEQTEELMDDLSKEVVDGRSGNVAEVEEAIGRFTSAVQTVSLFGERKVVWLKEVNFLSDTVTGRAQGTLDALEGLKGVLQSLSEESVGVLITAQSVDKRRSFYKWLQKNAAFESVGGGKDAGESYVALVEMQCAEAGVKITSGAVQLLIGKVNGNSRLIVAETAKLATYIGDTGKPIDERLVTDLVPNFGDADFFEAADAFYTLRLGYTLEALRRHFFNNKESRPLLGSLQARNRLLIQLRTLQDCGALPRRGVSKSQLEAAMQTYGHHYSGSGIKSNLNVFTQNPWYLGRLAETAAQVSLRKLIEFQTAFTDAFEAIIDRPNEQEEVCRELAVKCLS